MGGGGEGTGLKQNTYVTFQHYLHLLVRSMPFSLDAQKASISRAQRPPICPLNGIALIKSLTYTGPYKSKVHK